MFSSLSKTSFTINCCISSHDTLLLFPESLGICFMGCRVAKESDRGLEFTLTERDRKVAKTLQSYAAEGERDRNWYPWNSEGHGLHIRVEN